MRDYYFKDGYIAKASGPVILREIETSSELEKERENLKKDEYASQHPVRRKIVKAVGFAICTLATALSMAGIAKSLYTMDEKSTTKATADLLLSLSGAAAASASYGVFQFVCGKVEEKNFKKWKQKKTEKTK